MARKMVTMRIDEDLLAQFDAGLKANGHPSRTAYVERWMAAQVAKWDAEAEWR